MMTDDYDEPTPGPVGTIDVLNVGAGHLTFAYNKRKPAERAKAREIITDMLARGYTILVEVDGEMERVEKFDPKRDRYVIGPKTPAGRKAKARRTVDATAHKAVAVGRTAGG